MKHSRAEDHHEDLRHEDFEPKRKSLKGDYERVAPGNKKPKEEPIISDEPVGWGLESEVSQAPSGRAMHQIAGGFLMIIFMLMVVGIGAYVIYELIQTFDGYLQDEL